MSKVIIGVILAIIVIITVPSLITRMKNNQPVIEEETLMASSETLSTYTTKFNPKEEGRAHNIKLGASKIDGTIVQPGEVFSFNEALGPNGEKEGYQEATIYVEGEKETAFGGGVCQISSTLYNVCLDLEMPIVERHEHSLPVAYVPKDKDAATAYGGIDLKFKNDKPHPVKVNSGVEENKLTVSISKG